MSKCVDNSLPNGIKRNFRNFLAFKPTIEFYTPVHGVYDILNRHIRQFKN